MVYTSSTLGVVVDLKDGTASGSEIGADTLISIESVVGGLGPDTFTFNEENNTILGEGGDDKFFNLEMLGVDVAFGGEGADSFYWSGQGSFTLSGDAGRDTFYPEELVEKGKVVIKDFDAAEGDVLVLASLLPTLGNAWSDLKGGLASVSEVLTLDQENGFHSLNLSESYRDESGKILVADIYGLSEAPGLESILDTDGDGVADGSDAFPLDAAESIDTDLDGMGNNADTDDGDGVADISDAFPLDSAETLDTDSDGTGNNADTDDDNDEVSDADEAKNGTNPLLGDTDGDGVADNLDEITVALSFDDRTFKVEITTAELADNPITATDFRFGPKGSSCFVVLQSDKEAQSTSEKYVASRSWQVGSNFLSGQYGVIDDTPRIFFEDGSVKYDQQQYFLTVSNPDYVEQEIALEKVVISKVQDAVGELRVEATISGVSNEGFLSAYPFSSDARYNFKVHLKNGATYHGDAPHPEDVTKISDGVFKVATFHTVDDADDYANPKVQLIQVCDAAMHSKVWEQDADADGMIDVADAFPLDASETADIDSDGVGDNSDAFPNDATESLDSDSDSVGDNADNCPSISNAAQTNTDGDADGDACDSDDDNDGFTDEQELVDGTNPLSRFSCKTGCFSFDVDENLEAQPLTDGLLVIRHLFGFSGDSLTSGAVSGEASRGSSDAIAGYLTDADSQLDIDGDGEV